MGRNWNDDAANVARMADAAELHALTAVLHTYTLHDIGGSQKKARSRVVATHRRIAILVDRLTDTAAARNVAT